MVQLNNRKRFKRDGYSFIIERNYQFLLSPSLRIYKTTIVEVSQREILGRNQYQMTFIHKEPLYKERYLSMEISNRACITITTLVVFLSLFFSSNLAQCQDKTIIINTNSLDEKKTLELLLAQYSPILYYREEGIEKRVVPSYDTIHVQYELSSPPSLYGIGLTCRTIDQNFVKLLEKLPNISYLDFYCCTFSDDFVLPELVAQRLECLQFIGPLFSECKSIVYPKSIWNILPKTHIQRLHVESINEEQIKIIATMPKLIALHVSHTTDSQIKLLEPLRKNLRLLAIEQSNISEDTAKYLSTFPDLFTLCLNNCSINSSFLLALSDSRIRCIALIIHPKMLFSDKELEILMNYKNLRLLIFDDTSKKVTISSQGRHSLKHNKVIRHVNSSPSGQIISDEALCHGEFGQD